MTKLFQSNDVSAASPALLRGDSSRWWEGPRQRLPLVRLSQGSQVFSPLLPSPPSVGCAT